MNERAVLLPIDIGWQCFYKRINGKYVIEYAHWYGVICPDLVTTNGRWRLLRDWVERLEGADFSSDVEAWLLDQQA